MDDSSRQSNVHTDKSFLLKFLVLLGILILFIVNSNTIPNVSKIVVAETVSPPLKFLHDARVLLRNMMPFAGLRHENKILRERVDLLYRRISELKSVVQENERLKALIDFKKSLPYAAIPARVIGRDASNWSNSLIINKGTKAGIKQNRAVLSPRGLVGRVVEAGRSSAKVLLISDPNSKVGVVIQRNRQGGILAGRPDGRCKMIYISLDSDVAPGDKVMTAGLGSIFPKDMLVGDVVKVGKEPGRLYKYAIVRCAEDLSKLEEVICIK